jgi:hypothetical protein
MRLTPKKPDTINGVARFIFYLTGKLMQNETIVFLIYLLDFLFAFLKIFKLLVVYLLVVVIEFCLTKTAPGS